MGKSHQPKNEEGNSKLCIYKFLGSQEEGEFLCLVPPPSLPKRNITATKCVLSTAKGGQVMPAAII